MYIKSLALIAFLALTRGFMLRNYQIKSSSTVKAASQSLTRDVSNSVQVSSKILDSLFSFKPVFNVAAGVARKSIIKRGNSIGVDWEGRVKQYEDDLEYLQVQYDKLMNKKLSFPSYYTKPFHAYDEGNLSWKAAMEVEPAALSVHAHIYTGDLKLLEKDGDFKLRDNFHRNMKAILNENGISPKNILDVGCSTGLSTIKLADTFPDANIIGIDLSPYMLAVANYDLDKKHKMSKRVTYLHAAGEESTLGAGDVDMVSLCLVSHELPTSAARAIFEEAYRVLPAGGAFTLMDMNPDSPSFEKLASNPIAFAAFRSTEPWLHEYISMDLKKTLEDCGFASVISTQNSPRHRTVVAIKK